MKNHHIDIAPIASLRQVGFTSAFLMKKISKMLKALGVLSAEISLVFLTSQQMRQLNQKTLNHDYDTDVLTFDLRGEQKTFSSSEKVMIGEIYISLDMAKDNASFYGVSLKEEALRYVAHGLLHLMGYLDKTPAQKKKIHQQEDLLIQA